MSKRTVGVAAPIIAVSALLLAGCASNDSASDTQRANGESIIATEATVIGEQEDSGNPNNGGTITFAGYSMPRSLDPTVTQASGATGGTEMASIYGLLMRYDSASDAFVPQLAESLIESEDRLLYTLNLRDGVKFSDGTPMDAESVVNSVKRFNENNGVNSKIFTDNVTNVEAVDATTVLFQLKQPFNALPALLAFGHGMIVAPSGYEESENFRPIGAGPYIVEKFDPGISLTVTGTEEYWDGETYLDEVKFVDIAEDQARVEALDSGGIQMAYLRSSEQVLNAKDKYSGYIDPISVTKELDINGRAGRPGADRNVRKAIAHAVIPEMYYDRAEKGLGSPGKDIFQSWSKWGNDVAPVPTDPDRARDLVRDAKANGFDGELTYLAVNSPSSQASALAVQAMLNNVGFDVNIDYAPSVTAMLERRSIDHDFDITHGSYNVADSVPYLNLSAGLQSDSPFNLAGLGNAEMDQALDAVVNSSNDEEKREALAGVQTQVNDDIPFVVLGAGANFVPWSQDVNGAIPSADGIILLGKAWLS